MRFYFLPPVLAILLLPSNSLDQSESYPSATEVETLIQEMRQEIPKLKQSGFYLGRIIDGNLHTDNNLVLVLDSGFLVSIFVSDARTGRYEYANSRSLDNLITSSYHNTIN
jgi:hypothetical protein